MPVDKRGLRRRAAVAVVALVLTGLMSVLGSATEAGAQTPQHTAAGMQAR
ncbi:MULTISPECIES: hypothetical protein [Streptomyces]|nr:MULTISPECIES: hypothetical protein [Streptomyces]MBC2876158.1 hypothetical protein [Streptomyces sp. TYQ1024]UBI38512.1 hypothetical protein K7I03_19975 [Streptomyces mobaraensis]UKW31096.1 hypothetical protein MCU78_19930 [Streptomyces sp. TYQ1024]